MRGLMLLGGIALLAACSNDDQQGNNLNVDENLRAENIVSNDVTAIDAVTGDAANMAAEAELEVPQLNAGNSTGAAPRPRSPGRTTPSPDPSPSTAAPSGGSAPEPVANSDG